MSFQHNAKIDTDGFLRLSLVSLNCIANLLLACGAKLAHAISAVSCQTYFKDCRHRAGLMMVKS